MKAPCVYIIYSSVWDQYYVGSTVDFENRLKEHNAGSNKSTNGGSPWELKHLILCESVKQARKEEFRIKKKKSRKYIEWLIDSAG